jgi:hypothetical protein
MPRQEILHEDRRMAVDHSPALIETRRHLERVSAGLIEWLEDVNLR